MDNELSIINNNIQNLIYTIRGKQVMLDSDVAMLYDYETKRINEAVRRNVERFPEEFCFKITNEEYLYLKSQIATSNITDIPQYNRGGKQKLPYVFTEKGIIMLAGLLKNNIAIETSLKIVEAFVEMRKFINTNKNLFERVITIENKMDNKFLSYDNKFEQIFNALQKDENFKQKIFFEGQIYDAYSLIIDIIKKAKFKIVIIDNYIDDSILKMLAKKNKNVEVIILTSDNCRGRRPRRPNFKFRYSKI